MPVLVHIGYHKTGSTAIQQALPGLTTSLSKAGIAVPQGMSGWSGHPDLAWGFDGYNYPWQDKPYTRAEVVAHYTPILEAAAAAGVALLLSSEEFCRMDFNPNALQALADFLRPWQPRIFGIVRDPQKFLLSRWRHEVQMGGETRSLAAFLGDADNLLSADFERRTRAWHLAFGAASCSFSDYDTLCRLHQGSILPGFLELIGAAQLGPMAAAAPDLERKLHPLLCDAARRLTMSDLPKDAKARIFTDLFDLGDRLPPVELEVLLQEQALPAGVKAVLDHMRYAMINRQLLPKKRP